MPDGICPFATQIVGRANLIGYVRGGMTDWVGFCDHTAGGYYSTMTSWSFWNDPNGNGNTSDAVSVHFAIARDGRILQVLNIFDMAFAQGRLGSPVTWVPFSSMGRGNPNNYLISTEHEDYENGRWVSHWTDAQYESDLRVKRWCVEEVRRVKNRNLLRFGIDSLAGHHMFDPQGRANCPGKDWRDKYRQRLFNDLTGDDDMMQPHFSKHRQFNGTAVPINTEITIKLSDFEQPPPAARMVRVEVYKDPGPYVGVGHGAPGIHPYAGSISKIADHALVDVIPGPGGEFLLDCRYGIANIVELRIVGYWA